MATAPITPLGAGLAVGNLLSSVGLGFLSAHHQKAVQTEQNTLGSNVPATRAAFQKIMDSFTAGMIDASTAQSKLQSAVDAFKSSVASILKQSGQAGVTGNPKAGGKCNAACVWIFTLQAEADDLKKQLTVGTGGNPSATGSTSFGQRTPAKDAAGNPIQEFSLLPSLKGGNLALVLGGIVLFFVALAVVGALRKR